VFPVCNQGRNAIPEHPDLPSSIHHNVALTARQVRVRLVTKTVCDHLRDSLLTNPPISTRVVLGLIIPGLVLTTALLALYAYTAWKVVSRRYLDRVSFRLLTYALVAKYVDFLHRNQVYTTPH
jgi:hypothetical protein